MCQALANLADLFFQLQMDCQWWRILAQESSPFFLLKNRFAVLSVVLISVQCGIKCNMIYSMRKRQVDLNNEVSVGNFKAVYIDSKVDDHT